MSGSQGLQYCRWVRAVPGGTSITPAEVQCSVGSLTPVHAGEIQHPFIKGSGM